MFVTNWISTTKIQKISEITNFFRHYFLSRTEVVMVNEAAVPNHFIFEDKCSNFGEGIRWSRAARKYKTRFISDVVRIYHRDVIGSLTASNKKQRSMKHTYNLFVYELYGIKERRDLMLKYDLKSYISTLLALSYHSLCTGVSLNSGRLSENP